MDYLQTNNNPVVNWADRSHVSDAIQSTNKGAAWEYAIELANEAHKDLWINVPEGATDDYVGNLALLLKSDLDPSLHVYVEYSNEVWNSQFGQFGANYDAAQQEVAANPSVLNYDGSNNSYYNAWRRVGERTVQISNDFASVYGQSAINTTVPATFWPARSPGPTSRGPSWSSSTRNTAPPANTFTPSPAPLTSTSAPSPTAPRSRPTR